MAGNYPDAPGIRMAYERDGTLVARVDTNTAGVTIQSAGTVAILNDEDSDSYMIWDAVGTATHIGLCFLFPELRDVVAYAAQWEGEGGVVPGTVYTSVNTTNGYDGTWVNRGTWSGNNFINLAALRSPNTVTWNGVKAVRFHTSGGSFSTSFFYYAVHLYGIPSAGENPNRLRIWHPTLNQELPGAYLDWGNVPQGSSADRTFRVKNESATLTANGVVLSLDAPTNTTPSVSGQHLLSQDGSNFAASQNIGALSPGGISPVITLRRSTPSNAAFSLWWARVLAVAASWT